MIQQLPCVDCITLPICKSIALREFWKGNNKLVLISELRKKCELINNFLDSFTPDWLTHYDAIAELHNFFKTSQITGKRLNNGT